jgi:hypothetical protein
MIVVYIAAKLAILLIFFASVITIGHHWPAGASGGVDGVVDGVSGDVGMDRTAYYRGPRTFWWQRKTGSRVPDRDRARDMRKVPPPSGRATGCKPGAGDRRLWNRNETPLPDR